MILHWSGFTCTHPHVLIGAAATGIKGVWHAGSQPGPQRDLQKFISIHLTDTGLNWETLLLQEPVCTPSTTTSATFGPRLMIPLHSPTKPMSLFKSPPLDMDITGWVCPCQTVQFRCWAHSPHLNACVLTCKLSQLVHNHLFELALKRLGTLTSELRTNRSELFNKVR